MAGENTQNQQDPKPNNTMGSIVGNSGSQIQGEGNQTAQGVAGLTVEDVRRIVQEEARPLAQSEAYKAEDRVNRKMEPLATSVQGIVGILREQNPNLSLNKVTDEQIRRAQEEAVVRNLAQGILQGKAPSSLVSQNGQPQGQQGSGQGNHSVDMSYLINRTEEIFIEEGLRLDPNDPEASEIPQLGAVPNAQIVVSIREALRKKKARLEADPNARIASQVSGGSGDLVDSYNTEKAKLPRGQARAKALQELRMKYQRMGVDNNLLT